MSKAKDNKAIEGEVLAAIFMALHESQEYHDVEAKLLTIGRVCSPWNAKHLSMRKVPVKK